MNKLILNRPLVAIDIESAGPGAPDPAKDSIIDLALVKHTQMSSNGVVTENMGIWTDKLVLRLNPGCIISPERTEVHHITNEDVVGKPYFHQVADEILAFIKGCDLVGYNLKRYDVPLLHEELARCQKDWDLKDVLIIDSGTIFQKKDPRDLTAAVKKFCGRDHSTAAHGAEPDAVASFDVLLGQRAAYDDIGAMTIEELAKFSNRDEECQSIDLAGKFVLKNGVACYNFGNKRGTPVEDDLSLVRWMMNKDFTSDTLSHARRFLRAGVTASLDDGEDFFGKPL